MKKEADMKLSILLTSYNCEKYIDDAIKSVFNQDMPFEWELLIGDDGSDDATLDIVHKWINKYPLIIKLFTNTRDGVSKKSGVRASRNRARLLEQCSGEYISFLDGDDCLLGNDKFIKQIGALDSDKYKKCSCSASNTVIYYIKDGEKHNIVEEQLKLSIIKSKKYWSKFYFHTNTIVFRKECKELLLKKDFRDFLNDNFITYLIIQHGEIIYFPESYAQYIIIC